MFTKYGLNLTLTIADKKQIRIVSGKIPIELEHT